MFNRKSVNHDDFGFSQEGQKEEEILKRLKEIEEQELLTETTTYDKNLKLELLNSIKDIILQKKGKANMIATLSDAKKLLNSHTLESSKNEIFSRIAEKLNISVEAAKKIETVNIIKYTNSNLNPVIYQLRNSNEWKANFSKENLRNQVSTLSYINYKNKDDYVSNNQYAKDLTLDALNKLEVFNKPVFIPEVPRVNKKIEVKKISLNLDLQTLDRIKNSSIGEYSSTIQLLINFALDYLEENNEQIIGVYDEVNAVKKQQEFSQKVFSENFGEVLLEILSNSKYSSMIDNLDTICSLIELEANKISKEKNVSFPINKGNKDLVLQFLENNRDNSIVSKFLSRSSIKNLIN